MSDFQNNNTTAQSDGDTDPFEGASSLGELLVRALHLVRRLREDKARMAEVIRAALDLVVERDRQLSAARSQVLHLRAEIRAIVSGRTLAAERQELESAEHEAAA